MRWPFTSRPILGVTFTALVIIGVDCGGETGTAPACMIKAASMYSYLRCPRGGGVFLRLYGCDRRGTKRMLLVKEHTAPGRRFYLARMSLRTVDCRPASRFTK